MRVRNLILAATALLCLAPAATAQQQRAGVFDQPFRRNPFNALLSGRGGLSAYGTGELGNNTYTLADLVAIAQLRDDFRLSDVFLIGGLVPSGEGAKLAARSDAAVTIAVPLGGRTTLGLQAGGRVLAQGLVPDNIAALAREGSTADVLEVDITDLGADFATYTDVGLVGLFDLVENASTSIQVGLGVHYLYPVSYSEVSFAGVDGSDRSTFRLSTAGVDANLAFVRPTGFADDPGGSGFAGDAFVALRSGKLFASALVSDVGSLRFNTGSREVTRISLQGATFGELLDTLDVQQAKEVPSGVRNLTLPMRVRLEGSYQLHPRVGAGVAVEQYFGDEFTANPQLATGLLELRPLMWLPLRLGASVGGDFGETGAEAGFGLDFDHLRFNLGVSSTGSMSVNDLRGGIVRSSLSIVF